MDITQEKTGDLGAKIKVTITPADYSERIEKSLKEQAKKANLPGFRKGMVPVAHIKRMYGKSILVEEINNMLSETLNKYLTDNKVEILGQPLPVLDNEKEFKWDNTDEFEFEYVGFELDPEYFAKASERIETHTAQASIFEFL